MSMLAEPKRKVKWTLNPRGNIWAEDENNYGQKMLRKMGWEKGKGLGKNEDGNTDHIKVTYKNDKKGIGIVGHDDDWIAHQDDFNTVLSSLNEQFYSPSLSTEPNESKLECLEKKSKSSRSRVHYHKFIQGKDISRYSSKDMAAIFGNKKKESEESKDQESSQEHCKESSTPSTDITYNSGQSIQEYFNKKMAALGNKGKKTADGQNNCSNVPYEEDGNIVSSCDVTQPEPDPAMNSNLIKENQQNNVVMKRKKHKKQKKRKNIHINVQFECENGQSDSHNEKNILLTQSNVAEKEVCTNHHIGVENFTCNPSVISGNHTLNQDKLYLIETEHSVNHKLNFVSKRNNDSIISKFTNNDKFIEQSSTKKSKRKRKLDSTLNPSELQEYKDSSILAGASGDTHEINNVANTDSEISKRIEPLVNHITSSNEIKESCFPIKTKKLKKDKSKKNLINKSADPNLSACNIKKFIRCNALQQMELYFDVFPNRQTLPVLKKYEALCENFNDTGLASSNLLSVPGYGNELIFKD